MHLHTISGGTASSGMSSNSERKEEASHLENHRTIFDVRLTQRRGYKSKQFRISEELIFGFLNAIRPHKEWHNSDSILHHDVSWKNIIMRRPSPQTEEEVGDLIGFDHAKITKMHKPWRDIQKLKDESEDLDEEAHRIKRYLKTRLSLAAVKSCVRIIRDRFAGYYIGEMFTRFPSRFPANKERELELEDLGLEDPVSLRPHFQTEIGNSRRTGPFAYTSHRIHDIESKSVVHDAIHDIESFFWILVECALVYDGPGGSCADKDPELEELLDVYFDSNPGFPIQKMWLFYPGHYYKALDQLERDFMLRIQNYFKPVENLIREWWKTLIMAFQFEGFELANIHSHTNSIFTKTLENIQQINLQESQYKVMEGHDRSERVEGTIRTAGEDQHMITEEDIEEHGVSEDNEESLRIDDEEDVFGGK